MTIKVRIYYLFLAALIASVIAPVVAQADKADDLIKLQMEKQHIPGLALAVVQNGKVIKTAGYGQANLENNVPVSDRTIFEIGSMTKQFTASAIMLLVQDGKLALDDKISRYLEGTPESWKEITIRHLLSHTSGIKNQHGVNAMDKPRDETIKLVSAPPLEAKPGDKWNYCNTGYFLLGYIIETVSGKSYWDFLDQRIFKPLDMTVTRNSDPQIVILNRARGYTYAEKGYRNGPIIRSSEGWAAGSLVSNVLDLAKWDAALYSDKILTTASRNTMWTETRFNDGKPFPYGLGWFVQKPKGHLLIEHGGNTGAFSTTISRFVEDKLTVIVLTNRAGITLSSLSQDIAGCYVPGLARTEPKPIEDKEPKVTALVKDTILKTAMGTLDPNSFAQEIRAILFPDKAKEVQNVMKSWGELQSLTLLSHIEMDGNRIYRYRAVFKTVTLTCTVVLNKADKIEGYLFQPE